MLTFAGQALRALNDPELSFWQYCIILTPTAASRSIGKEKKVMTGTCICGGVAVSIEKKPTFVNDCNCSLCRKAGAAWGYFPSAEVETTGETVSFVRQDKTGAFAQIHSCKVCAATTHFVLTEPYKASNPSVDQVGVNMRIFEPSRLDGVEVRFPDGSNWIGEGAFGYRRSSMTISKAMPL